VTNKDRSPSLRRDPILPNPHLRTAIRIAVDVGLCMQKDIAEDTSISRSTVSNYYNNQKRLRGWLIYEIKLVSYLYRLVDSNSDNLEAIEDIKRCLAEYEVSVDEKSADTNTESTVDASQCSTPYNLSEIMDVTQTGGIHLHKIAVIRPV
jgi:transcriptional regulator with XRE-family HTH domain